MLKRIRRWFVHRFLPMWAKKTILDENEKLQRQVAELREELDRKEAYTQGLLAGMKSQRRIVINTTEDKK